MPDPIRLPLLPLSRPTQPGAETPALFACEGAPGEFIVGIAWTQETLSNCGRVPTEALRAFARELLMATAEALGVERTHELDCGVTT